MHLLNFHFGLEHIGVYVMYYSAIVVVLMSLLWRPNAGLYFLIPLLPLQTARYRLLTFPLGAHLIEIVLGAVLIGMLARRQLTFRTPLTTIIVIFGLFSYVSLWFGALVTLHTEAPLWVDDPRMSNWVNYMMMPLLFFQVTSGIRTPKQMRVLLVLMGISTCILNRSFHNNSVSGRDFSNFSYAGRSAGSLGYAGVNGLAAFEVQVAFLLWAVALAEKSFRVKVACWVVTGFCFYCMIYSMSRGAYAAFVVAFLYLALTKKPLLIFPFCFLMLNWQLVVPQAVVQRVEMTYKGDDLGGTDELDNSAQTRVLLWENALQLTREHFALGAGFNTYEYIGGFGEYHDTHNMYMKVLVELGITGFLIFMGIWLKLFWLGRRLYRRATDGFLGALGFGLSAMMVCVFIVNLFGDRWTFLQISGYTWVIAGFVSRGLMIEEEKKRAALGEAPRRSKIVQTFMPTLRPSTPVVVR
jgi:putative inorganic carbon (HCO3(-)) transporter